MSSKYCTVNSVVHFRQEKPSYVVQASKKTPQTLFTKTYCIAAVVLKISKKKDCGQLLRKEPTFCWLHVFLCHQALFLTKKASLDFLDLWSFWFTIRFNEWIQHRNEKWFGVCGSLDPFLDFYLDSLLCRGNIHMNKCWKIAGI